MEYLHAVKLVDDHLKCIAVGLQMF
jgi:hypothetical protein